MDYFYSAAEHRLRGALWPSFAPARISLPGGAPATSGSLPNNGIYDPSGDVINDGMNHYLYDAEGRACVVASEPIYSFLTYTAYLYNAEGQRVAKGTIPVSSTLAATMASPSWSCNTVTNGFTPTNEYVLDQAGNQMTELAVSGTTTAWMHTNIYAGSSLIGTYKNDGAGPHFRLTDWLGTTRVQTNYAGVKEDACQSLPFGDNSSCTSATEQFFTGKERDQESGNDYFGVRYYANNMGRFSSPDPMGNAAADAVNPQSWNMYSYVLNNPMINIDPTGMDCVKDNGDGTVTNNYGDCKNENTDAANHEHYINCDGCTSGAAGATLDTPTGDLYLIDGTGAEIRGTTVQGFASPQGVTTDVTVSGDRTGNVGWFGFAIYGGLMGHRIDHFANVPQMPDGVMLDPNAPPSWPKLKGKDKVACLSPETIQEYAGDEGGASDTSDTAPGKGGAAPVRFKATNKAGRRVTVSAGVNDEGASNVETGMTVGNWAMHVLACLVSK